MQLSSDEVYEYPDHGEILVLDVLYIYTEYDTETHEGDLSKVVRYSTDWDGYGPMPASTHLTPLDEFASKVGEKLREIDFTSETDE